MANLPLLSTTTLSTKDINLNVELDEKPLVEVNATIEKLNENLGNFINELKATVTGFNKNLEQNNNVIKLSSEKTNEILSNLNSSFASFTESNFNQRPERTQSLFNLSLKQIAKDTLGSVKDMALDKFRNNMLVKGFTNLKDAFSVLKGGAGSLGSGRKEQTQEQIEQNREKVEREERTNELLEDILEALLNQKNGDETIKKKEPSKNILQKTATEGTTGFPILDSILGIGGVAAIYGLLKRFGKNILDSIKSTFSGITAGLSKLVPQVVKDGVKQLVPTLTGKIGGTFLPKILSGTLSLAIDGFFGYLEDWEASTGSKIAGAILGGTGEGWMGAITNATKWGLLGATFGGPPGLVFGALLGAGLGAFGGENIAKVMDAAIAKSGKFFEEAGNWIGEQWEDLVTNIQETWTKNVTEPLDKLIDNFPSFDSIFDSLSESIEDIKKYFSNLIDSLNPFSSSEEPPKLSSIPQSTSNIDSGGGTPILKNDVVGGALASDMNITPAPQTSLPPADEKTVEVMRETNALSGNNFGATPLEETSTQTEGAVSPKLNLTPVEIPNNLNYEPPLPPSEIDDEKSTNIIDKGKEFLDIITGKSEIEQKTKELARDLVAKEESFVSKPMDDLSGNGARAIGYGFNFIDGKPVSELEKEAIASGIEYTISQATADKELLNQIDNFHKSLSTIKDEVDGVPIGEIYSNMKNPSRKAVLVSLAYQAGLGEAGNTVDGIRGFQKMWKNINIANQMEKAIFPTNVDEYWKKVGDEIIDSKTQKDLQNIQIVRTDDEGNRIFKPTRLDRADQIMSTGEIIPAKAGTVSYGPRLLLSGEYPNANQNPELTAPINFIKDEMVSATEKIISKVSQNYEKNPELTSVAVEQRITKTIEKAAEIQNRLKQKESMETSKIKMNAPIVNNNVVDNKQVTNNNQSLLMKQSSRNPQNIFRLD